MIDQRLLIPLDVLPGLVPAGAPKACLCPWCEKWVPLAGSCECGCDLCNVDPRQSLDLSPPPLVDGWPTRIDGADVAAGMLARAMRMAQASSHSAAGWELEDHILGMYWFQWTTPHRARSDKRRYRLLTIGRLIGWACREDDVDGWPCVPALADIDPADHLAPRLALAAVLRSQPWRST